MPNFVKTSLYELYNFVPKFLIKSFSRTANVYFLMICCLQSIRAISITDGKPSTAAPLMFILTVAALKEINEDLTRHKSDHEGKYQTTSRIHTKGPGLLTPSPLVVHTCLCSHMCMLQRTPPKPISSRPTASTTPKPRTFRGRTSRSAT